MAKDFTKYSIEGIAENLGKSKLAYAIIENYVSKNSVDFAVLIAAFPDKCQGCLLYTSPSPRDRQKSRMPSSA